MVGEKVFCLQCLVWGGERKDSTSMTGSTVWVFHIHFFFLSIGKRATGSLRVCVCVYVCAAERHSWLEGEFEDFNLL